VIGDEVEEIVATGELTEIKVEEEEGDRRNYKNGMERRNNCQLVQMTTIKTNCRHLPITELHASSSKEIVRNSTQSAIEGEGIRERDHRRKQNQILFRSIQKLIYSRNTF
jgi:hypothetical protein